MWHSLLNIFSPLRELLYFILQLTPHSGVLLEKLTITQVVKTLPAFYGIQMFITVSTTAHHWSLTWARWIQSIPSHPIYLWSILILSSHLSLCLPSGLLPLGLLIKILYLFRISPMCTTHSTHLIFFVVITIVIPGKGYKLRSFSLCSTFLYEAFNNIVYGWLVMCHPGDDTNRLQDAKKY
jgi:hypothetical protein